MAAATDRPITTTTPLPNITSDAGTEARSPFRAIARNDGYLPIEDHGLVSDCTTAALIGRDGAVAWLCVPRFDSDAVLCSLLDRNAGGFFGIAPLDALESRQFYLGETAVLVTEMRSARVLIRITDALVLVEGADLAASQDHSAAELIRVVEVLDGSGPVIVEFAPRGGASAEPSAEGFDVLCNAFPGIRLRLASSARMTGLSTTLELRAGERHWFRLSWGERVPVAVAVPDVLRHTAQAWERWMRSVHYEGPQREVVRRSALTLKMLDYAANGAIVAAPTASLPELIRGGRNWDYRYTWIRDAAFSGFALRRIGMHDEADCFLSWVLNIVEHGARPRVLYDLDGREPPPEREDSGLEGYRGSRPVRWGNAAADQRQHDVYGEILDCAFQWARREGAPELPLWDRLESLVERAALDWDRPDHGIWEVRTHGRPFTYSAAMCQVALDRGARIAQRFGLDANVLRWQKGAEMIREAILERAWDPQRRTLTEHLGGGGVDASLLALPLRRVLTADHPKMIATTAAIEARLGAGSGLLFRYLPEESPDGVCGDEGAFLLCSFWLVDNWARQGRVEEAMDLFDSLCARAGPLGLLPEQINPSDGAFLGNYPQAFSHVGVISSGIGLMRATAAQRE